ncbi:hypothetical protein GCM10007390_09540 [Persicitalea jodogahamensis]|uniref:Fibronectin type-III domain-containing protein n=1 Tax=Persicitalea jodogahamensis TaxID=402147 RepID=A0A8J3D0J4_9BACT|nr:hypothetical protein GCM10007390_09540 [Persicitalea jodogahamensis]
MLTAIGGISTAQTYVPVIVSGFNHDLIAEGSGGTNRAENTTTISFDLAGGFGGNNVMYSTDFRGNFNPTSPPPYGLPTNRIINSANLPGASYTLADYSANNTLFLAANGSSGTLTLQTPGVFSTIAILGSSAELSSGFTARLNFSDGSNYSTSFTVPDWFNGSNFAVKGIGRVSRTTLGTSVADNLSGDAQNPRLYDNKITLSPPFNNRILTSVTFTKTSTTGRTAILALTGITAVDAPPPPVALPATSVSVNTATANWQATPNAVDYFLDVSESPTFSTFVTGYNNLVVSNAPTKEITGLHPNTAYYYRLRASNRNGTSASSNTITFNTAGAPPCPTFTTTVTDVKCFGGSDGSIAITASGGTGNYQYSLDSGQTYGTSSSFTGLTAGGYVIRVKDANGCETDVREVGITQPATFVNFTSAITNVRCFGGSDGSIAITASGGTASYKYSIDGGQTYGTSPGFTGLTAGGYVLRVKDANGCQTDIQETAISQPAAAVGFTSIVTNVSCNGGSDGSVVINASGGTGTYLYSISNGVSYSNSSSFTELSATTLGLAVKDEKGCQAENEFVNITQPDAISFTTIVTNVKCFGGNDGSIVVAASGGTARYQYSIDGGQTYGTSPSFTGLTAGGYVVRVKDTNGCETDIQEVGVTQPATSVSFTSVTTNVKCFGGSDGSINVTAIGGTPGYTYSKDGGVSYGIVANVNTLAAGIYTIRVKDANGCETAAQDVIITEPTALNVTLSGNVSVTYGYGSNCTTLRATTSGGTPIYSYVWKQGDVVIGRSATQQLCPTETTTYTVMVTDRNGCTVQKTVTVKVQDIRCGNKGDKVTVCHNGHEICISPNAVQAHLDHGDYLGGCGNATARLSAEVATNTPLTLSLQAYPNPVQDVVTLDVLAPTAGAATFEVLDLTGRTRQNRSENLTEGLNQLELRLGTLPTGLYLIRAVDALGRQGVVKVSKQ